MNEELPEGFEYIDSTSNAEYIACAFNALSATDGIDEGLLDPKEKAKIRLIRSCLLYTSDAADE